MRSSLECLPCLVRQAVESARRVIADDTACEEAMRGIMAHVASMDYALPPPVLAQSMHRVIRAATGGADPYRAEKARFNTLARSLLPSFQARIARAADPFDAAVRVAIAGNVIDFGAKGDLSENEAVAAMDRAFEAPVDGDIRALREAAQRASRILFLADNAGEIVFDTPLAGMLPAGSVTVAVRGFPVINDATHEDAEAAGMSALARVIDNGSDAPGTILADCSDAFRAAFASADLVIAKGQGNYETLCDEPGNIFFLFKVKCAVVARHSGFGVGTHAVVRARSRA